MSLLGTNAAPEACNESTAEMAVPLDVKGDRVGLSRDPKAAQILAGLGALRLSAGVRKVDKKGKLQERVLALTDEYLIDMESGSLKIKHKVSIRNIKSCRCAPPVLLQNLDRNGRRSPPAARVGSAATDNAEAFIVYFDQAREQTKDFLLAATERSPICDELGKAYEALAKHKLPQARWTPSYRHERTLLALLQPADPAEAGAGVEDDGDHDASCAGALPMDAEGPVMDVEGDEIGLSRDPKAAQILAGLGALRLSAGVRKVDKKGKLQERVLVLTDKYMIDMESGSLKIKHKVPIRYVSGWSSPEDGALDGVEAEVEAFIVYIDQRQPDTCKDMRLASRQRDRIYMGLASAYQSLLARPLPTRQWKSTYSYEKELLAILGEDEAVGGGELQQSAWLEAVEGDEIGFSIHPKAKQVLKKGEHLQLALEVSKVSKKQRLEPRYLVLTNSHVHDLERGSFKSVHRVQIDLLSAYSISEEDVRAPQRRAIASHSRSATGTCAARLSTATHLCTLTCAGGGFHPVLEPREHHREGLPNGLEPPPAHCQLPRHTLPGAHFAPTSRPAMEACLHLREDAGKPGQRAAAWLGARWQRRR
eukprot:SAG11_NODE_981_length_6316_cov_7.773042_3_plen_592_part_00